MIELNNNDNNKHLSTFSTDISFILLKNYTKNELKNSFEIYKQSLLKYLGVTYKFLNDSYQFNVTMSKFDYQDIKEMCNSGQMELYNENLCCMLLILLIVFY